MKLYEPLEDFLNSLGYLYCTDEIVHGMVEKVGIRFAALPKTAGTEVGVIVQKVTNPKTVRGEIGGRLALLERLCSTLTIVPGDADALSDKLRSLLDDQRIYDLCCDGIKNPRSVLERMARISEELSPAVIHGPFSALMNIHLYEWREDVTSGHDRIVIPGYERLSEMIGGFNPGRLGLLLADTGFGKTNLGLSIALHARQVMPVCYANMEMSYRDICRRMAVLDSGIAHSMFRSHVTSEEWISKRCDDKMGMFVTDGKMLSPAQIKAWVRSVSKEAQVGLLIVDYDQCLSLDVSRDLPEWKALQNALAEFDEFSRDMGVYVLVLSQVNRDGQISGSHRSTYKAHTVLHFKRDEGAVCVHAMKNRHGKRDARLEVSYDDESSSIKEMGYIEAQPVKSRREVTIKNAALPYKEN